MSTSTARPVWADLDPTAVEAEVSDATLRIVLSDGRELSAPLAWFPRLRDATPAQRRNWGPIGQVPARHDPPATAAQLPHNCACLSIWGFGVAAVQHRESSRWKTASLSGGRLVASYGPLYFVQDSVSVGR